MNITITRFDTGLHVSSSPPYLLKYLKYSHRKMGMVGYKKEVTYEERLLYSMANDVGGLVTYQGFFQKICDLIHKNKDTFNVVDSRSKMPEIDWQAVSDVGPRSYQIEAVVDYLTKGAESSGIINATGGYGKTYCQAFTYAAWNTQNTILAIPLKQVFDQTYKKFCKIFPDKHIGRVGDGYMDISKEITITTFRSLKKCAIEKCEMLLIDELQGCTGEDIRSTIASASNCKRIFGFTATDNGLFNGADKVLTGIFGERLIYIPYDEALEVGAVVPGVVYMLKTPDCIINGGSIENAINNGIKKCKPRNQLIAKVVANVPKDWPSLTFVDHISDHLANLHPLMPSGTKYIHRGTSKKDFGCYALTKKEQKTIIEDFTNNKFQHLIGTDAFRAGVDIPQLRVVVQGSGGSSKIEIIQEALRGSRTLKPEDKERLGIKEDKTHFVVVDFMDNHDTKLENMALNRIKYYKEQGWVIKQVDTIDEIDWHNYS